MNDHSKDKSDARLDPWCLVKLTSAKTLLFGYADWHPSTGGLAWTRSTPVVLLDEAGGTAVTLSGQRYRLGQQIEQGTLAKLGREPPLAFRLLIGKMPDGLHAERYGEIDLKAALRWLTACKMARHLNLSVPDFAPGEVDAFLAVNGSAYIRLRASQRSGS